MAGGKGEDGMELRRGKGRRRQLQRSDKRRRFTKAKQDRFFEVLTATCNVTAAYKAAGVGHYCVYDHRKKYAAFRARWAEAVRKSYARLELMMIERMMNGTVKTVTRADGSVQTIHQYSDAIALQLLRLHRQTAAEAAIEHEPEEVEEVRARIADKLERLKARLERDAAEKGAGEGDGDK